MSKDSSITSSKNKAEQENFEDFWTFLKFQVLQKAGGRLLRTGKIYLCWVYVVTTYNTYDEHIQVLAGQKMIPILAGKSPVQPLSFRMTASIIAVTSRHVTMHLRLANFFWKSPHRGEQEEIITTMPGLWNEAGQPMYYLAFVQCDSEELIRDVYLVEESGTFYFQQSARNVQPSGWQYTIKPHATRYEYPGNLVIRITQVRGDNHDIRVSSYPEPLITQQEV